ncbi:MAG: hypothetical protein AOA65_1906 [Candidatus Bathyarchaeota archaeon BA1]|nr:MAG: hypothetical protein AOA65_1906 [Candidatus Bathyarchaeota archaeon BA1]
MVCILFNYSDYSEDSIDRLETVLNWIPLAYRCRMKPPDFLQGERP